MVDPVLFSIGEDEVTVSEFKYIYEKNNADKADYSKESVGEYLELYKKFKLKVHKARSQGLDTIPSLQKELEGYRKQLAATYLKDKEISEKLVEEVVDRYAEDREVSHIFVTRTPRMTTEQGEAAREKINNIHRKLTTNKGVGFEDMARTLSEDDVSSKNGGLLGFYTAPLPDGFYEFETALYNTKVGEFSKPVESRMGFHILKVSQVRPARGEMEIGHILIRKSSKGQPVTGAKEQVDSIYQHLRAGRKFEDVAKVFSQDKKTKDKGGYLGFFGINQYEKRFEDAAFALTNDGEITQPIETTVGYHIIKRISKRDNNDEKRTKKRIESRINNNERFKIAEEQLIQNVKQEANFTEDRSMLVGLHRDLDEGFYSYKWEPKQYGPGNPLFTLDDKKYDINDFTQYMKSNVRERLKFPKSKPVQESANEMYNKYVKDKIMAYEEANLEKKYPDFKALMREYREGILLFEITKNEVWDKASKDTIGLTNFYNNNTDSYVWPSRTKTTKVIIESDSQEKSAGAYEYAKKKGQEKFMKKYGKDPNFKIETEEVVLETNSIELADMEHKSGKVSTATSKGNMVTYYSFINLLESSKKSLKEARGYVIADYQDHLEKEWVESLKKEYSVNVNSDVLNKLVK